MRAFVVVALSSWPTLAAAEPCPPMRLVPEVARRDAEVTTDGGLVVMERSKINDNSPPPSLTSWKVAPGTRTVTSLAPGLHLVGVPPRVKAFTLASDGVIKGRAKVLAKAPPLLAAPSLSAIVSGSTKEKHVTRFVTVKLTAPAPEEALALVVTDSRGTALSWGQSFGGAREVTVYSTDGGCTTRFADGTQIAQPGDRISAFWVDETGRRSPSSSAIVVTNP